LKISKARKKQQSKNEDEMYLEKIIMEGGIEKKYNSKNYLILQKIAIKKIKIKFDKKKLNEDEIKTKI
jgi:hypothetical protein